MCGLNLYRPVVNTHVELVWNAGFMSVMALGLVVAPDVPPYDVYEYVTDITVISESIENKIRPTAHLNNLKPNNLLLVKLIT